MNKRIVFTALLGASIAHAQILKIDLERALRELPAANAFDADPATPPAKKGGLPELKWRELHDEPARCVQLAEKLQTGLLNPWVARVRLDCALRADAKKKDPGMLARAFRAVRPVDLREGPWKDSLRDFWVRAGLGSARPDIMAAILDQQDLLSKEQRAYVLAALGELTRKSSPAEALDHFRQSEELKADPQTAARIAELERGRDAVPKPQPAEALAFNKLNVEGAEGQTDHEIENLLDQNHVVDAAKKMVELLTRFPNGRFAKRDRERLPQLLLSADDHNREGEAQGLREVLATADPQRLTDWAVLLQRRGDDRGALMLAEKALETEQSSPVSVTLLWIKGRSAEFLGEYDKAKSAFNQLIQFDSATDEAAEALFRLSLIELRENDTVNAAKNFERLISMNRPRWDLGARYWRIRAIENSDPARAALERDEVIRQSPFTYYGLRLRAERDHGSLEFAGPDRSPLELTKPVVWLVGSQARAWERFRKLSAEGWLLEAQAELAALPQPTEPWGLLAWARIMAKANQFGVAIQCTSRAMNLDETLRLPRYLQPTFPKVYSRFILPQAKLRGLDPILVRSLIRQESAFGLKAVSTSNALGLMQLIPPTAREVATELKMKVAIPDDLFKPEINVPLGTSYIAKMIDTFGGNVPLGLAAYNAGPVRMAAFLKGRADLGALRGAKFSSWKDEIWYDELPWSETSFYVKAILRNILIDQLIDNGRVDIAADFWPRLAKAPIEH